MSKTKIQSFSCNTLLFLFHFYDSACACVKKTFKYIIYTIHICGNIIFQRQIKKFLYVKLKSVN